MRENNDRLMGQCEAPRLRREDKNVLLRLAAIFGVTALGLLAVFNVAEWYAQEVSMPRYCQAPEPTIAKVRRILTDPAPAGQEATRNFIVAAKLIYLVPQQRGETLDQYSGRLRRRISEACH